MKYQISYEMTVELLHRYLEKIYVLDKHKGTSTIKVQRLYALNQDLRSLVEQLRTEGHNVDDIIRGIKEGLERKYKYGIIRVYVDGAARGNDNPNIKNTSGIAFAIYGDSQLLTTESLYLGHEVTLPHLKNETATVITETVPITNNVAEYLALIEVLDYMIHEGLNASHVEIFSDSSLVVNQVNMTNATRTQSLIRLRNCAQELMDEFDNITITHIPREENVFVDSLVNKVLDEAEEKAKIATPE